MTHDDMVKLGVRWLQKPYANIAPYGHSSMTVIVTELVTGMEIPDVLGFATNRGETVLIEAKVSRSDFMADQKKCFRNPICPGQGMGDQRWYIAPKGIIPVELLPPKWGLLEYDEVKQKLVVTKRCEPFLEKNFRNEQRILCSAMCRLKIAGDDFIAIRVYQDLGMGGSKKKAELYIEHEVKDEKDKEVQCLLENS